MSTSPVYINGFHQATDHPCPQQNHMVTENNNSNKKASSKDECFQRMCIFCLHSKWRLERDDREHSPFSVLCTPKSEAPFCNTFPFPLPHKTRTGQTEQCCGQREWYDWARAITHVFSSSLEKQYSKIIRIISLLVIPNTSLLVEKLKTFI